MSRARGCPPGGHVGVGEGVPDTVGVGVGEPHGASEAVSAWPDATGGFVPPVGSQPVLGEGSVILLHAYH